MILMSYSFTNDIFGGGMMGCLKLEEVHIKRTNDKMLNFIKKEKQNMEKNVQSEAFTEAQVEQLKQIIASNGNPSKLSSIQKVVAIVVGALTIISTLVGGITLIVTTGIRLDNMEEDVSELVEDSSEMKKYLYENEGVEDQLEMINAALNIKVINVTDEETLSNIEDITIQENDISNTNAAFTEETPIGVDGEGNVYIAEDLIGETILLTYKDDGKDMFFLGQYNEKYHWDGYCVTNAYNSDGTLYGICESNFQDGKRIDYKTILSVNEKKNEWDYYSRICDGESNKGISIEYVFEYNTEKNFTNTNVRRTDILYVDDFIEKQDSKITQYYYGNTSNELYNDNTGNAYLIKFDQDGTVKTLYVGRFVNGYPSDNTNEAWSIAYAEKLGYYVLNTGKFKDGYAVNGSDKEFTIDEIRDVVDQLDIKLELKWKNE